MQDKWILFSYSIPASNAKARMHTWRRISATGAVQLKTGLQILPNREDLLENINWLIGEVHDLGGEAIAVQCNRVEGMSEGHIEQLFQAQVDPQFLQIQTEARSLLTATDTQDGEDTAKTLSLALRKLRKRCDAVRMRDFFPSGAAAKTLTVLESISERLRRPEGDPPLARLDRNHYQNRTWVTRARPYIDRLGCAWLIQRFIDASPRFRFLQGSEKTHIDEKEIPFDMNTGEFSHQGELITFEVMLREFGLHQQPVAKIGELVKFIDVQEGPLPDDAGLLKTLLDGLIAVSGDDRILLERALLLFDALHAGYKKTEELN